MKKIEMVEETFGSVAVQAIKALDKGDLFVDCISISNSGVSGKYRFFVYSDGNLHNVSRFLNFFFSLPSKELSFDELVNYFLENRYPRTKDDRSVTVKGCGLDRIEHFLHLVIDALVSADILDKRKGHFNAKYKFFE